MAFLQRFRWVIFGVAAVALIAAWQYTVHAGNSKTKIAGVLAPTPGPNSSGYISAKRAYLERSAASDPSKPAAALISLARLMRPAAADALRPSGHLTAVFVRFPASDPEAIEITTTISDAMNARAKELQSVIQGEMSGLTKELQTATGSRKKQVQQLLAQRHTGLAALKGDCACVYALVIENSTLGSLEAEQKKGGVRLVDVPDPPVATLQGWQLTPILPSARSS